MAVKVDDSNRSIGSGYTSEKWESDSVVTTQCDNSGQCLTLFGWTLLTCIGCRYTFQDAVVALFNLLNGVGVVVPMRLSVALSEFRKINCRTYEVTGISPQSNTVAQLLKGFASSGTL